MGGLFGGDGGKTEDEREVKDVVEEMVKGFGESSQYIQVEAKVACFSRDFTDGPE